MQKKHRKAPDDKTRSQARFSESFSLIYGRKVSQNEPNIEKTENFQVFFYKFRQFLSKFWATSLHEMVQATQQGLIRVSPVGKFENITAFICWNWLKNTQKSMEQQKSTLFYKPITVFSNHERF